MHANHHHDQAAAPPGITPAQLRPTFGNRVTGPGSGADGQRKRHLDAIKASLYPYNREKKYPAPKPPGYNNYRGAVTTNGVLPSSSHPAHPPSNDSRPYTSMDNPPAYVSPAVCVDRPSGSAITTSLHWQYQYQHGEQQRRQYEPPVQRQPRSIPSQQSSPAHRAEQCCQQSVSSSRIVVNDNNNAYTAYAASNINNNSTTSNIDDMLKRADDLLYAAARTPIDDVIEQTNQQLYVSQQPRFRGSSSSTEHAVVVPYDVMHPPTYSQVNHSGRVSPTASSASTEGSGTEFDGMERSCSPLPEVIMQRLRTDTFESVVKPVMPKAFKFYMEQHIENVIKRYKEREKRIIQLGREMSKVTLPDKVRDGITGVLMEKETNYLRLKRQRLNKTMFEKIQVIGQGAFGEVTLVRKKDTKALYALKQLRKSDVIKKNQAAHVKAERDILSEADNEWVVKLYYSFQDKGNLFFVMEYIPGGDLMALLIKKGIFEESLARFYIAELVCAIESVHKLKFIHRDVKPDNILICRDGHIKLTDFGLCTGFRWTHEAKYYGEQQNLYPHHEPQSSIDQLGRDEKLLDFRYNKQKTRSQAHSLVGTPNYIAPEVLERTGHTQLCDWWSVGVILYEMLIGCPPFNADTPIETQHKIINWRDTLMFPRGRRITEYAYYFIVALCTDKERRLGQQGADDLKRHEFFRGISWDSLRHQTAPYLPEIRHPTDTSNFDPVHARDDSTSTIGDGPAEQHAFYEFTFRRFFEADGHGCPTLRISQARPDGAHAPLPPARTPLNDLLRQFQQQQPNALTSVAEDESVAQNNARQRLEEQHSTTTQHMNHMDYSAHHMEQQQIRAPPQYRAQPAVVSGQRVVLEINSDSEQHNLYERDDYV